MGIDWEDAFGFDHFDPADFDDAYNYMVGAYGDIYADEYWEDTECFCINRHPRNHFEDDEECIDIADLSPEEQVAIKPGSYLIESDGTIIDLDEFLGKKPWE
ncbi:hypothetical protein SAMN02910369_02815 [Lachnospiraceae bacterium NE2001]|nr:hypothetical protein SAMN02910369_02815 [Lachnospiraceae bacterium NE2001]